MSLISRLMPVLELNCGYDSLKKTNDILRIMHIFAEFFLTSVCNSVCH